MTLFERVFGGNDAVYGLTEAAIDNAIAQYGEGQAVSFPDTAYSLPCYYAVTGSKVGTLGELKQALGVVKTLMTRNPRLNDAFMSGVATALCAEFIEVLKYLNGAAPYELPCYGHLSDAVIRNLGVPLVTGDIPGVAVILGSAPSADEAVALVKSYQSQGILITLVGGVIDQLEEKGYKTGDNVRVIPLGKDVTAVIHAVSVALRAALIFGNITPGDAGSLMKYTMERVPAFVNAFKPLDDVIVACGAGAIALGFPVVTNETENIYRVPKSLIVQEDVSKFNATSLEARDIKIKITTIDIPVSFASAFEGEIIRKGDMQGLLRAGHHERRRRDRGPQDDGRRPRARRDPRRLQDLPVLHRRGRGQEHAVRLRVRYGAQDPLLPELHRGRYAHRPARYDPYPRFEGRL